MLSPTSIEKNPQCKLCNEAFDLSIIIECDECKNPFHESCIELNGITSNLDLIHLCIPCQNNNQIYAMNGKPKKKKSPAKSSIPTLGGNPMIKSLRSRDIPINESSVATNARKPKKIGRLAQLADSKKYDICKLERRIEALETRLSSQQSTPCKCEEILKNKIAEIENIVEATHEATMKFIENETRNPDKVSHNDFRAKIDCIDGPVHFSISLVDKIADIERTIKEDRLLVEQLFINQLDVIDNRLIIQEETIKSCEALMELEATNDTMVQNQFADLNNKMVNAEKTIKIQNKILHQLGDIIERHNNTVVTHFALNKAYCAELTSRSQALLIELSEHTQTQRNGVVSAKVNNNKQTQQHGRGIHSNEASASSTQRHENTTNDGTHCTIHTQPLRVGGRYDYKRIRIHVRNQGKFNNEREICNSIDEVLSQFSNEFNSCKSIVTGLKYEAESRKLNECSLVVLMPKPVNFLQFNRFLSEHGFHAHRK